MKLKGEEACGVVQDSGFQFKFFKNIFLWKEVKKKKIYNKLLV